MAQRAAASFHHRDIVLGNSFLVDDIRTAGIVLEEDIDFVGGIVLESVVLEEDIGFV